MTNRANPTPRAPLPVASHRLRLEFSPDGHTMAANTVEQGISLWDIKGEPVQLGTMSDHTDRVDVVRFSRNGRLLATGGRDKTVMLWDITNRSRPRRLATLRHGASVESIAFRRDGRTIVIGSGSTAQVWDIADPARPARLGTFKGHHPQFSPDGRTLAAGDGVGRVSTFALWDFTPLDKVRRNPAQLACRLAGGGLSEQEWTQYIPELTYQNPCPGD